LLIETFCTHIEYVVLAKQPITDFLKIKPNNARSILKDNLVTYLIYHTNNLAGAHNFLPDFLNKLLNWLLEGTPGSTAKDRKRAEYLAVLCESMVKRQPQSIWNLVSTKATSKTNQPDLSLFDNPHRSTKIAAAAAVGDLCALRQALPSVKEAIWNRSYIFGQPLALAAAGNHLAIVRAVTHYFEFNQHLKPSCKSEKTCLTFAAAIDAALAGNCTLVAQVLIQIYNAYFPVLPRGQYSIWRSAAVQTGDLNLTRMVMRLKTFENTYTYYTAFQMACQQGNVQAVRIFIEDGHINIDQEIDSRHRQCALRYAVEFGDVAVVEELLNMGADPNGPWPGIYLSDTRVPWCAVERNNAPMLKLLLDRGASPEHVQEKWDLISCNPAWKDACSGIDEALKHAKEPKDYFVNKKFPKTRFGVGAPHL
jgi:hypothetical protein